MNRHSWAVPNATGTHAAVAASSPSGIGQVDIAGTARLAACEPAMFRATTRSPTAGSSTPAPTSITVPAARYPTMCGTDGGGEPARCEQVAALDADRLDVDQHAAVGALGSGTSS